MVEEQFHITPHEFKNRMLFLEQEYGNGKDEEEFHREADYLICEIMKSLGYEEGIEIFERNPKWYS